MDMKNVFKLYRFAIIIIACSHSVIACTGSTDHGDEDEIMKTSEQIGFRPLFRHRQLMEERDRLKQQRLDELRRRSNTKHKLIYGDFKGKKYQPPPPYTITYVTWNRNLRDKQANKRTPFPSGQQLINNWPYFYTNTNMAYPTRPVGYVTNYYPLNTGQRADYMNW